MHYKYIIFGAGPSGLSFSHTLLNLGITSFLVIEKENVAGGLCRSKIVDGKPLDIGGGHFLDVRKTNVLDLLFKFLPKEEWNKFSRISHIQGNNFLIDYPFEANIWQLPIETQLDILESISISGSNTGADMPEGFEDWIKWKLGDKISNIYMLPYNRKLWSENLDKLGTYWLYKLPNVSFRDTLKSCIEKKPSGEIPAHLNFYYPKKYGYGEVWERMGRSLKENILFNTTVTDVDVVTNTVNGKFTADKIVNTIPWTNWTKFKTVPDIIKKAISSLEYIGITVDYYPEILESAAHWIYDPRENQGHHRMLLRHNFLPGSKGFWTETNTERSKQNGEWFHNNPFAYPLNTKSKPENIKVILEWATSESIIGLGRWGEWEHMNSDVSVERGIQLAEKLELN